MNRIKLIAMLMFCVMLSVNSFSQKIIDANGDQIANVESSGIIKDMQGNTIGEFMSNGDIKDGAGVVIGSISGTDIKDGSGATLAIVNAQGQISDMNNTSIGSVQFGVMLVDANNHVLLRTDAVMSSEWFAAYYLFFNNDEGI